MWANREQVVEKLKQTQGLEAGTDLVALGWLQHLAVCDGYVRMRLHVPETAPDSFEKVQQSAVAAVASLGDSVRSVIVEKADQETSDPAAPPSGPMPGIRCPIAVGAGKGGVGKSTVAVNLAVGLSRRDHRVGLLDGDIYGPSVTTLMGLQGVEAQGRGQTIHPLEAHGLKTMTMGALVDADKPLIWRGPMAHGAFNQLLQQTDWGQLDHLVIDLPPGTGDVPLTMAQSLPIQGAVIVCTPQRVAQDDAVRAVGMFQQLNVPVLGVVENMSYFVGDDGKEYDLFGKGGAAAMAEKLNLPLLGQIPIHTALRSNSDAGNPTANFESDTPLAEALETMVDNVLAALGDSPGGSGPTLSVH